MASTNPVSPKVVVAGLVPLVFTIVLAILDWVGSSGVLATAPIWVGTLIAGIGSVIASYVKTDPLRVPTVDQAALDDISE